MPDQLEGPFGRAEHLASLSTSYVAEMYKRKCGVDITQHFHGVDEIFLFRCSVTGYRFWQPAVVAGDEFFYRTLSQAWKEYYRDWRWEYDLLMPLMESSHSVLEVGCGRGYFLRGIENRVKLGTGLELNRQAIENKVTKFEVRTSTIEQVARDSGGKFDVVCSFQVLEHVTNPAEFIRSCLECLKPGGMLALSTPNIEFMPHVEQRDAFDLPPHHMGHFSEDVYRNIARYFNVEVRSIFKQPRYFSGETVTQNTRQNLIYRIYNAIARKAYSYIYRLAKEPGANILVVLRKPVA